MCDIEYQGHTYAASISHLRWSTTCFGGKGGGAWGAIVAPGYSSLGGTNSNNDSLVHAIPTIAHIKGYCADVAGKLVWNRITPQHLLLLCACCPEKTPSCTDTPSINVQPCDSHGSGTHLPILFVAGAPCFSASNNCVCHNTPNVRLCTRRVLASPSCAWLHTLQSVNIGEHCHPPT